MRQLEPDLHIDGCEEVVTRLAQFMPRVALVKTPAAGQAPRPPAGNVSAYSALEALLAAPPDVGHQ